MKKTKNKDKDLTGDPHEALTFGELDGTNGLSDKDAKPGMLEFTCAKREHNVENDGYHYHVKPVKELEELDFIGKTVKINGVERHCHSLDVVDGEIVIFVTYESTVQ